MSYILLALYIGAVLILSSTIALAVRKRQFLGRQVSNLLLAGATCLLFAEAMLIFSPWVVAQQGGDEVEHIGLALTLKAVQSFLHLAGLGGLVAAVLAGTGMLRRKPASIKDGQISGDV
jgi:hypothetical protein